MNGKWFMNPLVFLTKLAECCLGTWAILKPETCGERFQSNCPLGRGARRSVTDATALSLADFGTASWPTGWSFSSNTIVLLPWWPWLPLVCKARIPQRPVIQSVSCVLLELNEHWRVLRASSIGCVKSVLILKITLYTCQQKRFQNSLKVD